MGTAEISVRLFFTSDECDIAPSVSICFPVANLQEVNWSSVLADLVAKASDAVDGAPLDNLRPMTVDETATYRAAERADES